MEWTRAQVEAHESWRIKCLNLIASENYSSRSVRELQSSDFIHRYPYWLDNNPLTRYYQGNKYIQEIEVKATELAKDLFNAEHADIRPLSGMSANLGMLFGLTEPNNLVIECGRDIGGHMTVTKLITSKIINLRVTNYPADITCYNIDLEKAREMIRKEKPKLLTLGASIFPFPHPVHEIVEIAEEIGAHVSYDASHVLGLIAGKQFQQPLDEGADILLGSTHKTFAGPQGGIILSRNSDAFGKVKLCPNIVDNHHPHRIPGLIVALAEYKEFGEAYATQVIKNAKALGAALFENGFNVLFKDFGFTASHAILLDVSRFGQGRVVAKKLEEAQIILNAMQIPTDITEKSPTPSGLRIGVQEMTRFGMKEEEMKVISRFLRDVLIERKEPAKVASEVASFRSKYQTVGYCFDSQTLN
ncbi:MAG TPA: serine hydroxymethyltransferase [Candidatus Bathyarchaeia archaeon]|nr:serine hydroxymethyltransferase [Candidatus Bathyarchaeia archaeon]